LERARGVGVRDLQSLVDYSFSAPSTMWILLAGVEFVGSYASCWEDYVRRRRVGMGARTPFPRLDVGVELDVDIRISPAYLLLPFEETKRTWQRNAPTLLKYIPEIPTALDPHYYISMAFPASAQGVFCAGLRLGGQHQEQGQAQRPPRRVALLAQHKKDAPHRHNARQV
jgi:hypothetical protein